MTGERFLTIIDNFLREECGEIPEVNRQKYNVDRDYVSKTCHSVYNLFMDGYKQTTSWDNDNISRVTLYKKVGYVDIKLAEYRMEKNHIRYYLPKRNVVIHPSQDFEETKKRFDNALSTLNIALPKKYEIKEKISSYGVHIFSISYEGKEVFCTSLGKGCEKYNMMIMRNQGYVEIRFQGLSIRFGAKGPTDATPLWRDGGSYPSL